MYESAGQLEERSQEPVTLEAPILGSMTHSNIPPPARELEIATSILQSSLFPVACSATVFLQASHEKHNESH